MKNGSEHVLHKRSDESSPQGGWNYLKRVADKELSLSLQAAGAVLIEGPRACGKTAAARNIAASEVMLDIDRTAREMTNIDPSVILDGPIPRLIDEWQQTPLIWNHIRHTVDNRQAKGQFILTGSSVPADDVTRHSGAGRIIRLRLRPMSLFESGQSHGRVSLKALLGGTPARSASLDLPVRKLAESICVGGWPGHIGKTSAVAMRLNRNYVDEICRVDLRRVDGVQRDPGRVRRFIQSLARNVSTCASLATIARDVASQDQLPMTGHTAREYLGALERLMVVEDQPPWAVHLRSRSRLQQSAKRHFVDPSVAAAALQASPEHLLNDFELFGLLFESMVVRDLRVYAQAMDANVHHYRDNTGLEVDAIIDAGPGRWAAFEIKLGSGRTDEAAKTLLKFAERVDSKRCGKPAALAVIVDSGYGFRRPDGVNVIPVVALGP